MELGSVSCSFRGNLSKPDRVELSHPAIAMISSTTVTDAQSRSNLVDFFLIMIAFTLIPLGGLVGNLVYIEQARKSRPPYLKHLMALDR